MTRRLLLSFTLLIALAPVMRAEAPPAAEAVGVSTERLQRLRAGMQRYVDEGRVSGIVVYVTRAGRVVAHEAFGKSDVEAKHRWRRTRSSASRRRRRRSRASRR